MLFSFSRFWPRQSTSNFGWKEKQQCKALQDMRPRKLPSIHPDTIFSRGRQVQHWNKRLRLQRRMATRLKRAQVLQKDWKVSSRICNVNLDMLLPTREPKLHSCGKGEDGDVWAWKKSNRSLKWKKRNCLVMEQQSLKNIIITTRKMIPITKAWVKDKKSCDLSKIGVDLSKGSLFADKETDSSQVWWFV